MDRVATEIEPMNNNIHSKMRCLIDWVSFTFARTTNLKLAFDVIGIEPKHFKPMKSGYHGYKKHLRYGHIAVLYDGTEEMGIHVIISGQGCREYEQLNLRYHGELPSESLWKELIEKVINNQGKFTRIDIAIDDFTPHFTIDQLYKKMKDGLFSTKLDKFKYTETGRIPRREEYDEETGTDNTSKSLLIGSDSSNMQFLFYDKYREREDTGHVLDDGITAWNRIELRFYAEHTHSVSLHILQRDDLGRIARSILHNYVNILEKSKDTNRSRWRNWRAWNKFLGDVDKLKLEHVAPDRSVQKSIKWMYTQGKKTLAKIFVADDGNIDRIMKFIAEGSEKLTEDDIYDIKHFQRTQQISDIIETLEDEYSREDMRLSLKKANLDYEHGKSKKIDKKRLVEQAPTNPKRE